MITATGYVPAFDIPGFTTYDASGGVSRGPVGRADIRPEPDQLGRQPVTPAPANSFSRRCRCDRACSASSSATSSRMVSRVIPAGHLIAALALAGAMLVAPAAEPADYHPITPDAGGQVITLTGHDLTIEEVVAVARHGAQVRYSAGGDPARRRRRWPCGPRRAPRIFRSMASIAAPARCARFASSAMRPSSWRAHERAPRKEYCPKSRTRIWSAPFW